MALYQTRTLMKKYGKQLINNTITDDEIDKLFDENEPEFNKSTGFVDYDSLIGDANFSKSQGINDFVLTFASQMTPENLHKLNQRMLKRAPNSNNNGFMRGTTIEKVLLSFEMVHYQEQAESLFKEPPISETFSPKEIASLKRVILMPIVNFFKQPQIVTEVLTIGEKVENLAEFIANPALIDSIANLISQAAVVKATEPGLAKEVDNILNETSRLLTGEIDGASYLEKANACIGHASVDMQILGGCMRLIGKLLAGLGTIFSDRLKNYGVALENKGLQTSMGEDNYKLYESIQKVAEKKGAVGKLSQEVIDKRLQIIEQLLRSKYATLSGATEQEVYQWVSQNDPKVFDFIKPVKKDGSEIRQKLFDDLTDGASYDFKKGLSEPFENIIVIADPESLLGYQAVLKGITDALSAIDIINGEIIEIGAGRMTKTKAEQFLIDKLAGSKEMIIESVGRLKLRKSELEADDPSLKGTSLEERAVLTSKKEPKRRVTFADKHAEAFSSQSSPTVKGVTFFAPEESGKVTSLKVDTAKKEAGETVQNDDNEPSSHKPS